MSGKPKGICLVALLFWSLFGGGVAAVESGEYIVEGEDTLWKISKKLTADPHDWVEIAEVNGISGVVVNGELVYSIYEGQRLRIPGRLLKFKAVEIKKHDTLWQIAIRETGFARNWIVIAAFNNLIKDPFYPGNPGVKPLIGKQLRIPTFLVGGKPDPSLVRPEGEESVDGGSEILDGGGQDFDSLYAQIFGHRPQNVRQLLAVYCEVDAENLGTIKAWIPAFGQKIELAFEGLRELLAPLVTSSSMVLLEEKMGDKGFISREGLSSLGYSVEYDRANLVVRITTPSQIRSERVLSLTGRRKRVVNPLPPAKVSGYLNVHTKKKYIDGRSNQLFQAHFSGAMTWDRWVTKGSTQFNDFRQTQQLDRLQVLRDFPETDIRFQVGDLDYPVLGRQSYVLISGVGLSKGFLLPDDLVGARVAQFKLTINTVSEIEIWVNDKLQITQTLEPGNYDLRDFPLEYGFNRVEVWVTDANGEKTHFEFPYLQDQYLVDQGAHEFSYNFGSQFRYNAVEDRRDYFGASSLSVFHRYGLYQHWTVGPYFQGTGAQSLLGLESVYGTALGLFRLDLASSTIPGLGSARALEGSYVSYPPSDRDSIVQRWGFGFIYKGLRFGASRKQHRNPP